MAPVPTDRVQQLAATSGLSVPSRAAAESAWELLLSLARAKWPGVKLDEDAYASFVAERLAGEDLATALGTAPGADLALAAACAAQEPTAHAAFDSVLNEVDAAGVATNSPKDLVDEVKQLLRLQLLVPRDGKPAAIVGYRGKGPLRGWLRITATRELIRHKKKRQREAPLDKQLDTMLASGVEPGLAALKAEYRAEFAVALREAITDLSAEDRTLLRQQIVDGMSIDAVGAAYGVHRATAARWLTRARSALVAATHKRLAERLELPAEQMNSVIRLVSSQLDASVIRYLRG
jgi:RNA polymerase sigma-70 factor (ECF subfamily)